MKINGITNSMNFGLTKSQGYTDFENHWISTINNPKKKIEAQRVADAIGKRVPGGYLEYDATNGTFYLLPKGENKNCIIDIGKVYYKEPHLTTLLKLNKALKDINTDYYEKN